MTADRLTAFKDPALPPPGPALDTPDWHATLGSLDRAAAERLVVAVRTLYPHDGLADPVYRRVVAALDRLAAVTPGGAGWLAAFGAALDAAQPLPFVERSEGFRVQALKAIERTAAFRFVQRAAVRYLYDDLEVWHAFGYEGASSHLGGYIERGFDDLDWLPPVPAPEGSST